MIEKALLFKLCFALSLLVVSPVAAQIDAGLDQSNLASTYPSLNQSTNPFGQWFTVGRSGVLSAVELSIFSGVSGGETLSVEIRNANDGLPGVTVATVVLAPGDLGPAPSFLIADSVTATLIDVSEHEIEVQVGDVFAIWLETTAIIPEGYAVRIMGGNDLYPDGQMTTATGVNFESDLTFKTFVAQPVFGDGFETGDTRAWSNGAIAFVTVTPYVSERDISWIGGVYCQSGDCPWNPPSRLHDGIDFMPESDLIPFRSGCDGTVSWIERYFNAGNGFYQGNVLIECSADPNGGLVYAFEPMSSDEEIADLQMANIVVDEGDPLNAGDVIGNLVIGGPGSHLHWGVTSSFTQVCPRPHLTPSVAVDLLNLIQRDQPTWEICH